VPINSEPCSFGKHQRLLTASEFKAVFDGACYKSSQRYLLFLARPNLLLNARLGTAVSKKNAKLAVQRNRLKRLLREQFRLHQQILVGLDIVALVKPGLWQQDNTAIVGLIDQQWERLIKQHAKAHVKAEEIQHTQNQQSVLDLQRQKDAANANDVLPSGGIT